MSNELGRHQSLMYEINAIEVMLMIEILLMIVIIVRIW
jgi:hypothetical protein